MRFLIILTVSILIIFPAVAYSQATWYVDGTNTSGPWLGTQADPFQYIQDGIDATSSGDTVLVLPFTYMENIDFKGKAITVKSEQGSAVTVIDGNQNGSVVLFNNGEGLDSVLEGFTVKNGTGISLPSYPQFTYGGGIHCDSASPTIMHNQIVENMSDYGGGIYGRFGASPTILYNTISYNSVNSEGAGIIIVKDSSPIISNNTITENTAKLYGGGLEFAFNCSLTITNNVIKGNVAVQNGGGGIVVGFQCLGTIADNIITGNSANRAGGLICQENTALTIMQNTISENHSSTYGGGIYCIDDYPSILNNTISQNTATSGSAGIHVTWLSSGSDPEVKNNIIMGNKTLNYDGGGGIGVWESSGTYSNNLICYNSAQIGGGFFCSNNATPVVSGNTLYGNSANKGGGIAVRKNSTAIVTNTILWNNQASNKGPEIFVGSTTNPSTVTISYSDVDGGQASVHVESGCTLNWGPGMINDDPLFVDSANGDYHLTFTSPCKDTGDNTAVTELTDFEGDPRIAYGTVDMGADEFYTHLYWTGDATPSGNVEVKFVGLPGTAPVGLCIGTGVLDPPLKSMWGDWYLAFPIIGPVGLGSIISPEGVLVIPGTIPGSPPAPYSIPMQALIGAELTNLSVLEVK